MATLSSQKPPVMVGGGGGCDWEEVGGSDWEEAGGGGGQEALRVRVKTMLEDWGRNSSSMAVRPGEWWWLVFVLSVRDRQNSLVPGCVAHMMLSSRAMVASPRPSAMGNPEPPPRTTVHAIRFRLGSAPLLGISMTFQSAPGVSATGRKTSMVEAPRGRVTSPEATTDGLVAALPQVGVAVAATVVAGAKLRVVGGGLLLSGMPNPGSSWSKLPAVRCTPPPRSDNVLVCVSVNRTTHDGTPAICRRLSSLTFNRSPNRPSKMGMISPAAPKWMTGWHVGGGRSPGPGSGASASTMMAHSGMGGNRHGQTGMMVWWPFLSVVVVEE